jgi:hypothetical protein
MKLLVLAPSVLLISVLACQSGSGGAGVATSDGDVSGTEPATNADSNQYEDWARAANLPWIRVPERRSRETREETKLHEARGDYYRRAAAEESRKAQEAWTAGAGERLQAEAERARQSDKAEEDVPTRQQQ